MSATTTPERPERPGPVLLFDGACGLCQRLVRLLQRLDRRGRLHFAPLQGAAAQAYLRRHGLPVAEFDTLVFVPDWSRSENAEYRLRTDGAIAALRAIGGGVAGALAGAIALFPARIRDAGYRMVSRWRQRIFGSWQSGPAGRSGGERRFLE